MGFRRGESEENGSEIERYEKLGKRAKRKGGLRGGREGGLADVLKNHSNQLCVQTLVNTMERYR